MVAGKVTLAIDDEASIRAGDVARILSARGIEVEVTSLTDALVAGGGAIAHAPATFSSPRAAAALAAIAMRAAAAGTPLVLLAAAPVRSSPRSLQQAAALGLVRASGALILADPDAWMETAVLLSVHGLPRGSRVALIAPPTTWVAATAEALAREAATLGGRFPAIAGSAAGLGPVDAALIDVASMPDSHERAVSAMLVPVVGRGELLQASHATPPLVGLRAAIAAIAEAGRFAQRLAAGLGRADAGTAGVTFDEARFAKQLDKLGDVAGDHETKVLLAAYQVPITRQAVATTPSAAARIAKRAGFPVEVKPWGPDVPSEADGCPVVDNVRTAADVRRAFAQVARDAAMPDGSPVIVRETPPVGRELSACVEKIGALGWMVIIDVPGSPGPAAAPAPLRPVDAAYLASHLEASRAGDPAPDRNALAQLLERVSYLATDNADVIERISLHRIVVTPVGGATLVADASAELVHG